MRRSSETSRAQATRRRRGPWIWLLLLAPLATPTARAWTPASQTAIARQAARIAPPDLRRQLDRHARAFQEGVRLPFEDGRPERHVKSAAGTGLLDRVVIAETRQAIREIRDHRPFELVVRRLGVLAHFVADANNPLAASESDPREPTYSADYLRYLESAEPRFAVVFYGDGRDLAGERDLERFLRASLERGRRLYPSIGAEYRRVGRVDGVALFDDRSTAFGVGALAFSHAVSDVAAVLRYVWIAAGGADLRRLPLTAAGSPGTAHP